MTDEKQISWIYEGPKSSVNCEDYLLGKKIDKNFEIYSDVIKKEEEKIDELAKKRNSIEASKVSSLKVESIVGEDPLVAIRVKQAKKEKAALENPVFKKKIEDYLRKKFEVVYRAQLKLEKIAKNLKDKSSESSDFSSSDSDEERKKSHRNTTSSKHTYNKSYSHEKYKRKNEYEKRKRNRDYSDDSDISIKRDKKHYDRANSHKDSDLIRKKRRNSYDRYSDSSVEEKRNDNYRRGSNKNDLSYDKKHYDSHKNLNKDQKLSRSERVKDKKNDIDDKGKYSRNNYSKDKKFERKPMMTAEEMEVKRREMMENAKWREDSRKKILEQASTHEIKEEMIEKETRLNEVFKPKLL